MQAEYIAHLGDDLTVVNAARVSFNKHKEEFGEEDEKLINYLARHGHWTPFAHPQITMRETIPIFVARQRIRHTIGFAYNEVSRRYVDGVPRFFSTPWRERAEDKKQGSGEYLDSKAQEAIDNIYRPAIAECARAYREMLAWGVCPEQARMVLPLSLYTSWYVTGSLAAWARAYKQRSEDHAQVEIQELATQWDKIINPLFPQSWRALNGKT